MKVPTINPNTPITIGLLISVAGAILYVASAWGQVTTNVADLIDFKRNTGSTMQEMNNRLIRMESKFDNLSERLSERSRK